jgi:hypothetical protein
MAYTATETLSTRKSPEEVAAAAQAVFTDMHMTPHAEGSDVSASSGSFLLTWLLGFISSDTNMPIRVTVSPSNGTVTITAEDTYPIPIKIAINGKIHRRANALAQQTRDGMEQRLS